MGPSSQAKIFPLSVHIHIHKCLCGNQEPNVLLRRPGLLGSLPLQVLSAQLLAIRMQALRDRKAQGMKQGSERHWWKVVFQRTFPLVLSDVILYLYN